METDFHSFVIKIWWEETTNEAPHPTWRGRITHVPSKEWQLVKDMQGILSFVQPYLGHQDLSDGLDDVFGHIRLEDEEDARSLDMGN